jgi:hypothetical protein
VTGGGVYCLPGGTALSIGLAGSETNVAYQLYLDTGSGPVEDGSTVIGNGSALNFGSKTATGTYTIVATRLSGSGCSANHERRRGGDRGDDTGGADRTHRHL